MLLVLTGATGFIGQYLLRELPKRGQLIEKSFGGRVSFPFP